MARDEDDLRINTLHALSKYSPGLVLEEHGHCEVPAGCGGVVLRWRDPAAGSAAVLSVACKGRVRAWLDEAEIQTGYLTLRPGRRVLLLELREVSVVPSPLVVVLREQLSRDTTLHASSEGPAWQARPLEQPEAPFVPMRSADDLLDPQDWRLRELVEDGARPLRVEAAAVLVRFVFDHTPTRETP